MKDMIEIDGNSGEGGGQILRTALSLAAVNQTPCRIFNIRKKRKMPGLMTSHLSAVRALARLTSACLEGDYLGSDEIKFRPKKIKPQNLYLKIDTAASITLILQALIPPALLAKSPVQISFKGGATDTFFSPTLDSFQEVFLKILEKMGGQVRIKAEKRGFYPKGGAEMSVEILPSELKPLRLTSPGGLKTVLILSKATKNLEKRRVAQRQISGVKQILGKLNLPLEEKASYCSAQGAGSVLNVIAKLENTVLGADNLGKLGKSAEQVGKETALKFLKEVKSGACLDRWTADQILPYMALANGKSEITVSKITEHCQTNIWVIERFMPGKFEIDGNLITYRPARD